MHVISRAKLMDFWLEHPAAERPLRYWYRLAHTAGWRHFADVKATFPSADAAGKLVIFDIGGNKYRLVAYIDYTYRKVFVRSVLTHAEYDRQTWKRDPW